MISRTRCGACMWGAAAKRNRDERPEKYDPRHRAVSHRADRLAILFCQAAGGEAAADPDRADQKGNAAPAGPECRAALASGSAWWRSERAGNTGDNAVARGR